MIFDIRPLTSDKPHIKSKLDRDTTMATIGNSLRVTLSVCIAILIGVTGTLAQRNSPHIALKGGESVDLRNFFVITNCQSSLIGKPEVEVLEGPDELVVTFREEMILPRAYNCPRPVPGGILVATAKEVTEQKEATLTFRIKFNTKQGPRQNSNTYIVSLYPGAASAGGPGQSTPSMNSTGPAGATSSH
jgi:hypothetical protein